MFVKPRSAFVGCPSVVCSSSGSAKNARYARLLPSTRKSSESRAGPSSRTSSSPVSVFGTTAALRVRRSLRIAVPPSRLQARSRMSGRLAWIAVRRVPLLSGSRIVTSRSGRRRVLRTATRPRAWSTWPPRCETRSRFPLSGPPLAAARAPRRARRRSSSSLRRSRSRERRSTRDRWRSRRFSTSSRATASADEDVTLLVAGGLARRAREKGARAAPSSAPGARIPRQRRRPRCGRRRPRRDLRPTRGSIRPSSTPTSSSWSRPPRPSSTAARARCSRACDAATIRRAAAARSLVQASREPVVGAGAGDRGGASPRGSASSASRSCSTTRDSRDGSAATPTTRRLSSTSRARRSGVSTRCSPAPCGAAS